LSSLGKFSVGILGLGQMGGSLAGALKARDRNLRINGFDIRKPLVKAALKTGIIENASGHELDLIESSEILILALPISIIIEMLDKYHRHLLRKILVIDFGSIRAPIQKTVAKFHLNNHVGIHPVCGTASRGCEAWNANLFEKAPCFVFAGQKGKYKPYILAKRLIKTIGGKMEEIDFIEHDAGFALTSGLPHIIAYSLLKLLRDSGISHRSLQGPSFASATRVASSDPEIVSQFLFHNRKFLIKQITGFEKQLKHFKALVATGDLQVLIEAIENYGKAT